MALDKLLARQKKLERHYRGFLSSLDRSRTATLRQVLEGHDALGNLNVPWLQLGVFRRSVSSLCEFLDTVPLSERVRGFDNLPLVFYQSTSREEDAFAKEAKIEEEAKRYRGLQIYQELYGHLPPEVGYLHIEGGFLEWLEGTWRSRKRVIVPHHPFTSKTDDVRRVDRNGKLWSEKPSIIGFRLPDYPAVLSVDDVAASEYIARMVNHDLGHWFLPQVGFDYESLHNVAMIYAADARPDEGRGAWASLVYNECTNPYFFLEADKYLEALGDDLSVLQDHMAKQLRKWYAPKGMRRRKFWSSVEQQRRRLWGLEPSMSLEEQKEQVTGILEEMREDGFSGYYIMERYNHSHKYKNF